MPALPPLVAYGGYKQGTQRRPGLTRASRSRGHYQSLYQRESAEVAGDAQLYCWAVEEQPQAHWTPQRTSLAQPVVLALQFVREMVEVRRSKLQVPQLLARRFLERQQPTDQ